MCTEQPAWFSYLCLRYMLVFSSSLALYMIIVKSCAKVVLFFLLLSLCVCAIESDSHFMTFPGRQQNRTICFKLGRATVKNEHFSATLWNWLAEKQKCLLNLWYVAMMTVQCTELLKLNEWAKSNRRMYELTTTTARKRARTKKKRNRII